MNKQVKNYELYDVLGKGAFGVVYKALNITTGATVALKAITLKQAESSENRIPQSELNEISLLQQLQYQENILEYLDHFLDGSTLYIATEYIETGSLQQILKSYHSISEDFALNVIFQLLKGLQYLHSQGILHRDLKASNILLDKNGVVKIADFGVSETVQAAQNLEEIAGTPYWLAKEVLLLECCDEKSDIWAVGATLIELLTGNPPYFDLEPPAACYKIATQGVVISPDFSPRVRQLLEKCFSEHNERPTAEQLLAEEFNYTVEEKAIVLEQLEKAENEFSDDSDNNYDLKRKQSKLQCKHIISQLKTGQIDRQIAINRDIMNEVIFKQTQAVLDGLQSVSAYKFIISVLKYAREQNCLDLAMRKLEFSSFGLIRRLIKFFNIELVENTVNLINNKDVINENDILDLLMLINASPAIFPLFIESNLFILLKEIFQYTVGVKNAVIQTIFLLLNLEETNFIDEQSNETFGSFSEQLICQFIVNSDICVDLCKYLLKINTYDIEDNQFTTPLTERANKCLHSYKTIEEFNTMLILVENTTMILKVICQYFALNDIMSCLCELHSFYVQCRLSLCSFPKTILQQNLDIIQQCYNAHVSLSERDISLLLESSQVCKEAESLCIQIFTNSPEVLYDNLDFYRRYRKNLALLGVLVEISPQHKNINTVLSYLEVDVYEAILQEFESEPTICINLYRNSYLLGQKCVKFNSSKTEQLIKTLSQKKIMDIISLKLCRENINENQLLAYEQLAEECTHFAVFIINDPTLILGFLKFIESGTAELPIYLSILKQCIIVKKKQLVAEYNIARRLEIIRDDKEEVLAKRVIELLELCE